MHVVMCSHVQLYVNVHIYICAHMEHRQISTIQKPTCTSPTETCQAPFAKLCTPNIFGVCLMYEPKWLPVLFFLGGGALVSRSIVIAQHSQKPYSNY